MASSSSEEWKIARLGKFDLDRFLISDLCDSSRVIYHYAVLTTLLISSSVPGCMAATYVGGSKIVQRSVDSVKAVEPGKETVVLADQLRVGLVSRGLRSVLQVLGRAAALPRTQRERRPDKDVNFAMLSWTTEGGTRQDWN
jgi:hypothetical protein